MMVGHYPQLEAPDEVARAVLGVFVAPPTPPAASVPAVAE